MKGSIRISKACHSAHYAQDIVRPSEDEESRVSGDIKLQSVVLSERISEVDGEDSRVNSGQVGSTRWLMFLGGNSERVNVDTISRGSGVVMVSLVVVEVATFLNVESLVTIELDLSRGNRVTSTIKSQTIVALGNSDILVDSVSSRVSGSVINLKVLNRDGEISQIEVVSAFNSLNADGVKSTIRVRDNDVGALDVVRELNSVVVSEQGEVKR